MLFLPCFSQESCLWLWQNKKIVVRSMLTRNAWKLFLNDVKHALPHLFLWFTYSLLQLGQEDNFKIATSYDYSQASLYDPGSVMHYGPYAFAEDPTKKTIKSLTGAEIGQSLHLSDADVQQVKSMYDSSSTG